MIAIRKNSRAARKLKAAKDINQTKLTKFGIKCYKMRDYVIRGGEPNYRNHPPIRRAVLLLRGLFLD